MSFLKKLFGTRSFDDERQTADALYDEGRHEEARIAYQRALDRKKGASEDAAAHCEERMHRCLDAMAEARIAEAEELIAGGDRDLAAAELGNAMEMAASKEVAARARRLRERLERDDAKEAAEAPAEMSDEDRWALLAGSFTDERLEEYDGYGEALREALLALHDGRVDEALPALESILEDAEEPAYLWLEVGRARLAKGDEEGGAEALREALEVLDEEDAVEARLAARVELASIADRKGDEEAAIGELQGALDESPEDPRPYLALGQDLRSKGHAKEAADVIEAALPLLDEVRPDWRVLEALGLAYAEAGDDEAAEKHLDHVIQIHVALRRLDFPPASAVALAELYERTERPEKAADLWRSLAQGSDVDNHLRYHREAARVLASLGLSDEARRMWTRALALAEGDDETSAQIEAELAAIED
ncbi:MAG: tetratricopeptide repeat protein [Sandaracinaceae bacterium]|nr:tetratricopeptide repeat protein [Sandaracinaceae bacterium]